MRRGILPAAIWLGLNGLDWSSWLIGGPACLVAAAASSWVGGQRGQSISLARLPGFVAYFALASFRGGIDVSRRALDRRRPLNARIVRYVPRLAAGPACTMFSFTISVLPGTLVARVSPDHVAIHCIGESGAAEAELRELEARIARLFDLSGPAAPGDARRSSTCSSRRRRSC